MSRGRLLAAIAAALVVVVLWYVLLLAPKSKQLSDARKQLSDAKSQEQTLQSTLRRLQALAQQRPSRQAELQRLAAAVPAQPDLAGFILSADKIAVDSGVDWQSISPTPPSAGVGGAPATISMTIQVQGGFFQVLDYLNRVEHLERVVVVDSLQLTASQGSGTSPPIAVSLAARMFTTAPPQNAATTGTTTPGTPGATTTTAATTPTTKAGG